MIGWSIWGVVEAAALGTTGVRRRSSSTMPPHVMATVIDDATLKHITHILDKLGAPNHTAAVDRARVLDLLR